MGKILVLICSVYRFCEKDHIFGCGSIPCWPMMVTFIVCKISFRNSSNPVLFFFFFKETVILIRTHEHESNIYKIFKQSYNILHNQSTTTKWPNLYSSSLGL